MLLVVHNLPSHITYNDVKILVRTKCYIDDIILDKLTKDGPTSKKVTIGVAKDDDAFKIMEGLNGTFVEGQQISVEDVRKSSTDQSAGWNNPTQSQATDYMNNLNAWNMQMYQYGMQGYGYGMQGNTQGMGTQYPGYGVTGTAGIPSLMQSGYMAYGNQQGQLPQGQYGLQQPILGSKDSGSKSRSPTRGYDSGSAQKGYSSQQFQKNDVGYQTDKPIAGYGSNAHNRFGNQSITDQSERGSQSWGNNRFSGGKDGSRDVVGRKRPHSPDRNERDTRSFGDSRGSGGLGGNQSRGFERSHGKGLGGNQGRLDDESWERGLGGNQARDDDESWGKGLGGNQNRGFDSNPRGKGFGGGLGSSGGLGSGGLGGNQSKGFDRNPRGKGFGGLGSSGGLGSGGLGGNQSRGFDSSLGKGLGANQSRGFDNYHRGKGLGGCLGSSGGLGSGGLGGNQGRGLESSFGKGLGGNQRGFDNDSREKGLGGLGSSGGLGSGGLGGNHGRSLESSFGKGLGGKQRGFDNDTRGKGLGGGLGSSGGLGSGGLGGNQSRGFESSLLKGLGANQRVPETESWGTGLGGNQNRSDLRLGGEQGWYEDTRGNFGGNPNRSFETDHGNAFGNQGKGFANNSGVSTRDNQKPGKPLSKSENPYSWNSKYNPPKNAALNNPPMSSSTNFVPPSNASKPVNPLPSQSFGKPPEKRAKTDVEPNKVLPTDDNMGKQRHLTWRGMAIAYIAKAIIRQYVKAGHKQKYGKDCLAVLKTAIGNQMEVIFKRKFPENPFPEMREADIVQLYRTVHPFYQDIQLLKKEFAPARTFADNPCPSKKKKKNKTRTRKGALIGNAGTPPIANVAVKKPEAEFKKPTLADLLPPSVRQAQNQPNMNAYPKSKNKPPKKLDPIQLEKQAKRERKLLHKTEFLDPSLHKCKTPLMESALNSVLDELTDVYIKAIEDYETKDQNEKVVGNAIINKTTTEFRTTVRLHTVKRVLNETSTLMLRLFINGGKAPKTEVERVMQPFGINYMKSSKTSKFPMLMALVDSYETYDKLCAHPGVPCNGRRGPVLITAKPLHLTIPMKFRRLLRSKKLDEPDDDEVDFEDNPDDFDDDDVIEVVQPEPDVIELSGDEKPINTSVTTDDGNNDDANDEKNDDVIAITNVTGDSQNNSDVIAITNAKDDGKNDSIVIEDDKNFNDKECEVNTVDLTINDDVTEETDDKNVEADEIGDGLVEIDHDVVGEDDLEDY